jgi:hypothetical protein
MTRTLWAVAAAAAALTLAAPASAHHSLTAYDLTKTVTIDGTVKSFEWTNPHVWLTVTVKDKDGKTTDWAVESGTPNVNNRLGWKRTDLQPGQKVKVVLFPMRDHGPHGALTSVTFEDGRTLQGPINSVLKAGPPK